MVVNYVLDVQELSMLGGGEKKLILIHVVFKARVQLMNMKFHNDCVSIDDLHRPTKNDLMSRQLQGHLP